MTSGRFAWTRENEAHRLSAGGALIGTARVRAPAGIAGRDEIEPVDEGVFRWTWRLRGPAGAAAEPLRVMMEFVAAHAPRYCLIPAVSYDGNRWGGGHEPKGFVHDGVPWTFAAHRIAIPGATYSEGPVWGVALYAIVHPDLPDCAGSLEPAGDTVTHRLIWPEEEQPRTYVARDEYADGFRAQWRPEPGREYVLTAYIVVARVRRPCFGWTRLLDVAWRQNYREVPSALPPEAVRAACLSFALKDLWAEEGVFRGFSIGLKEHEGRWRQRPVMKYEIGWAGQNAAFACALLHEGQRTGEAALVDQGRAVLDCWVRHGRLENGLVRCLFDHVLEPQPDPEVQDACNLGTAADRFFEAEELVGRGGAAGRAYLETALGICDFAVAHQEPGGRLGKSWRSDGTCLDPEGTIGAFLIPPLLTAQARTGEKKYLDAAERAFTFYAGEFERGACTTAGALDTTCIDKESAHPLLEAALRLAARGNDAELLALAERIAQYVASWQWHHSVRFPAGTPLAQFGYDTFGGTAVSTQHHHLDPGGIRFVPSWVELAQRTGRDIWFQRARAVWRNGLSGMSDGTLALTALPAPLGAQYEGFFHTRWISFGGVSWLVAWPAAFRLDVLRRLEDWGVLK